MTWVLIVAGTLLTVELFLRLPVMSSFRAAAGAASKAYRTITAKFVSDHWREKALLNYSRSLLSSSLRLFVMLVVALLPMIAASVVGVLGGWPVLKGLSSLSGILVMIIAAASYYGIRKRLLDV